jgi:hypothetical protein
MFFADPEVYREKCLGERDCYLENSKAGVPKHEGPCEDPPWRVHSRVAESRDVKINIELHVEGSQATASLLLTLLLYCPAENI